MKNTRIINCSILLLLAVFSLSISGCSHKDKEVVIIKNVRAEAKQGKNQVKKYIKIGDSLLEKNKYDDAKSAYEKAIKFDKMNKDTYLTIENKYIEKNRIQDAADIIQEAINNDVDTSDMKKILLALKQKIEIASEEADDNKRTVESLGKAKTTSKSVKSEGEVQTQNQDNEDEKQNDTVETAKMFIIIENVYDLNGKRYLSASQAQYFEGSQAVEEAEKDGSKLDDSIHYYVRKIGEVETFQISNNVKVKVEAGREDPHVPLTVPVSYDQFKAVENGHMDMGYYWGYLNKYKLIVRLEAQGRP